MTDEEFDAKAAQVRALLEEMLAGQSGLPDGSRRRAFYAYFITARPPKEADTMEAKSWICCRIPMHVQAVHHVVNGFNTRSERGTFTRPLKFM